MTQAGTSRKSAWKSAAGAFVAGAGTVGILQLAWTGWFALTATGGLPHNVEEAVRSISGHVALFLGGLVLALAVLGGAFGMATALACHAFGLAPTRRRAAVGAVLLALLGCARTIVRRPALFEDPLWREGGVRRALQSALNQAVAPRILDGVLLAGAGLVLGLAAFRFAREQRPRFSPRVAMAGLALAAVVGIVGFWPHHPAPANRAPSVIVLASDSLRPDRFSSEGNPHATTPVLDSLRPHGAFFEDFTVPLAATAPSWTTYLTGRYPHAHGVRDIFFREEQRHPRLPTLPTLLREHGYRSAVVTDYAGDHFSRLDFGFDDVDAPHAMDLETVAEREIVNHSPLALGLLTGRLGQRFFPIGRFLMNNADPALLTDRAFGELDRLEAGGEPFLLVVFYSVTHLPFAAPMPDPDDFTTPGYAGRHRFSYELPAISNIDAIDQRPSDADVQQIRALYDGAVHAFDREVGRVLARLDADGVTNRLLVVAGDHGENLFEPTATTEHGKWFNGGDAAWRTTFFLEGAGVPAGDVRGPVSGVDVLPTLLGRLQLPAPAVDGEDVFAHPPALERPVFHETATWLGSEAARPEGTLAYPPITGLLEADGTSHALEARRQWVDRVVEAKLRSVREGRWQLVATPIEGDVRRALFDRSNDPYLEHDVAAAHPEEAARLWETLQGWMSGDPLRWLDGRGHLVPRRER